MPRQPLPLWAHHWGVRHRMASVELSPIYDVRRYRRIVRGYRRQLAALRRGSFEHHEIRILLRRALRRVPGNVAPFSATVAYPTAREAKT